MDKPLHILQADRGKKRLCQECGTRYYDLSRQPAVCPKCGVEHVEPPPAPTRRPSRAGGWPRPSAAPLPHHASSEESPPDETEDRSEDEDEDRGEDEPAEM